MQTWLRRLYCRYRHRVTHTAKFPKGDLTSFFLNLADRGFEPRHLMDIGANEGKWSRKARRVFPNCRFTLVEPQIEMRAALERFCLRSPGSQWINAGVGEELGELPLTVVPDTVSSSFTVAEETARAKGYSRRVVPIITLDYLVERVTHCIPDIVKIDAEGFESRILRGAGKLMGQTEIFLLELPLIDPPPGWSSFLDLVAQMDEYGYVPYDFTTFLKRPHDGAIGLCEVAFARKRGVLRAHGDWYPTPARAA
jgi:FkbM family methyltransferase